MRHGISRSNRFLASIVGLTVIAILVISFTYAFTESARLDIQRDSRQVSDLRGAATRFADDVNAQDSAIDDYLLSADPQALSGFEAAVVDEAAVTAEMRARATNLPGVERAIDGFASATAAWRSSFARPAIAAVQDGGGTALLPFSQRSSGYDNPIHAAPVELTGQLRLAEDDIRLREDALSGTRTAATVFGVVVLALGAGLSLLLVRRLGRALEKDAARGAILNSFTEALSFAADDTAIARAGIEALALLVHPDIVAVHVVDASQDRAVSDALPDAAVIKFLPIETLSTCAGMLRGSLYVSSDLAAPLSVHCPVYPAGHGTLACLPVVSGETIGAIHLYWERPRALPVEIRRSVVQIVAHAALTIGNHRLMRELAGQASTDARTGLANSHAFDRAMALALASRAADEPIAVLMLDLDRFKNFNDRHGHPSGDTALRTFAEVLRSCMRDGDLAARYGGEEFAVLLPGLDPGVAITVAERIRARTEATIIALAPGITDSITVSIGVAVAPMQALEPNDLIKIADTALYQAKADGRNRVVYLGEAGEIRPGPDAGEPGAARLFILSPRPAPAGPEGGEPVSRPAAAPRAAIRSSG